MAHKQENECSSLLDLTTDTILGDKSKYDLHRNCMNDMNFDISKHMEEQNKKFRIKEKKYRENKHKLKRYNKKKNTFIEELNNNANIINFLVVENRIILGVIILLIFLIYKYILK
tara:strand:- start:460 stop:804 length:345 start_codon:yes stop_codon:yes gene_type:complete